MISVAVTGGAGSGKSLVCRFFQELGAKTISLDGMAREVVSPGTDAFDAIVKEFGSRVLSPDGDLDRGVLRRIITQDREAKRKIEAITHPEIFRRLERRLRNISDQAPDSMVVIEVPVLVETGSQDRFDVIVLVEADPEIQKRRIALRDGCSAEEAQNLISAQASSPERRRYADYIIQNVGGVEALERAVGDVYRKILGFAQK